MNQHTSPWSEEDKAKVFKLWNEGASLASIGLEMGRSKSGVQGIIDRAVKAGMKFARERQEPGKKATPEQIATACRLFTVNGLSTDAVGQQVGLGRDYVRKLVRRHGWKKPVVLRQVKAPPTPRAVDDRPRRAPKMDVFAPLPFSQPRPWLERGPFMCKWPVGGDGADMLMCCSPAPTNRYCDEHSQIAFRSVERKAPTEPSFMRRRAA